MYRLLMGDELSTRFNIVRPKRKKVDSGRQRDNETKGKVPQRVVCSFEPLVPLHLSKRVIGHVTYRQAETENHHVETHRSFAVGEVTHGLDYPRVCSMGPRAMSITLKTTKYWAVRHHKRHFKRFSSTFPLPFTGQFSLSSRGNLREKLRVSGWFGIWSIFTGNEQKDARK